MIFYVIIITCFVIVVFKATNYILNWDRMEMINDGDPTNCCDTELLKFHWNWILPKPWGKFNIKIIYFSPFFEQILSPDWSFAHFSV